MLTLNAALTKLCELLKMGGLSLTRWGNTMEVFCDGSNHSIQCQTTNGHCYIAQVCQLLNWGPDHIKLNAIHMFNVNIEYEELTKVLWAFENGWLIFDEVRKHNGSVLWRFKPFNPVSNHQWTLLQVVQVCQLLNWGPDQIKLDASLWSARR